MNKILVSGLLLVSTLVTANADEGRGLLRGIIGATAGAIIGNEVGGRNGAVAGGFIGATVGLALRHDHDRYDDRRSVVAVPQPGYYRPVERVGYIVPQPYRVIRGTEWRDHDLDRHERDWHYGNDHHDERWHR